MTKLFLTADTHFGHANIIEYTNRPFRNVECMNKEIIRRWNERVKPEDTVIHLGDFCFRNTAGGKKGEGEIQKADFYKKQLNGNIVFIKGNHDEHNGSKIKSLVLNWGGEDIFCVHEPFEYSPNYRINLVGHIHNLWKVKKMENGTTLINVGVDVWNYYPAEIKEVMKVEK